MILSGKKYKELQSENEELKKQIDSLSEKEERLKRFDELIKKARIEYANIALKKDQTAHTLETLDNHKAKLNNELYKLSSEIKQLREIKLSEQNQLLALKAVLDSDNQKSQVSNEDNLPNTTQIIQNEIETAEKRRNEIVLDAAKLKRLYDELKSKVKEITRIKENLTNEVEKKKEEISSFLERKRTYSQEQLEDINAALIRENDEKLQYSVEIQSRINLLRIQEKDLVESLSERRKEFQKLNGVIEEKQLLLNNQVEFKQSIEGLTRSEFSKKEQLLELDIKIEAKKAELESLTEDSKSKSDLLNDKQAEYTELLERIRLADDKLTNLNNSIEISTLRLTDLDYSLNILDEEYKVVNKQVEDLRGVKAEIESRIKEKTSEKVDLEELLKELRETTSILAQLKNDIEKGSGQSAKRFSGVLQYYSSTINELYGKKIELERDTISKEKEVNEKENLIEEKQLTLDEMESSFYLRQHRLVLFEELARAITKQRKLIESNTFIFKDITQKEKLVVDNQIPHEKLLAFENALKELLNEADTLPVETAVESSVLEKQIIDSSKRLNDLNNSIVSSTEDLAELKNSINKIKIEHEDHRLEINKLAALKKKLEDDINRYKGVIDKYTKIKDMIHQEQELIKTKRELFASGKQPAQSDVKEKVFEPHTPNWIKL